VAEPAAVPSGRTSARDQILASAVELFVHNGIRAVGIDAVIEHSGVTRSALYREFPSKDGLVAEVLRRRDLAWRDWFRTSVFGATDDPAERLLAVFDALESWFAQPDFRGSPFINVRAELIGEEHPALTAAADHVRRVRECLTDLATQAGAPDPPTLAAQLQQLMKGAIVMAQEHEPRAAELARRSARTLLADVGLLRSE
jgi:AcrR family transcriptional regulator